MIWCITWAATASIVAVIEFAVAYRCICKYEELRKLHIKYRYLDKMKNNELDRTT